MPKTKSEYSRPKDKLLDGGMRGKDKQRTGYRKIEQYHTSISYSLYDQMKTKSRDSCPKDKLLDGGMRGKDKQRSQTIAHRSLLLSPPQ
jgi:hypothetical protein